jgi:hypothetical protein
MAPSSTKARRARRFDRTPLFIGIVILPLAASCAFSFSGFAMQRTARMPEQRPAEIRIILTERDRRQEGSILLQREEGEQELRRDWLHLAETPEGLAAREGDGIKGVPAVHRIAIRPPDRISLQMTLLPDKRGPPHGA